MIFHPFYGRLTHILYGISEQLHWLIPGTGGGSSIYFLPLLSCYLFSCMIRDDLRRVRSFRTLLQWVHTIKSNRGRGLFAWTNCACPLRNSREKGEWGQALGAVFSRFVWLALVMIGRWYSRRSINNACPPKRSDPRNRLAESLYLFLL